MWEEFLSLLLVHHAVNINRSDTYTVREILTLLIHFIDIKFNL